MIDEQLASIPKTDEQLASIPKIYAALQDDESRDIYKRRLLYSLTGDGGELLRVHAGMLPDPAQGKVCLYGAGESGHWFLRAGYRPPFVVDKFQSGELEGVPIITLDEFLRMPNCREYTVVVSVVRLPAARQILAELASLGLRFVANRAGTQYFDLPALGLRDECFVDGGAMDGADTDWLLSRGLARRALVFEPNPRQTSALAAKYAGNEAVAFFPCGLSDADGTARFETRRYGQSGATASADGDSVARFRTLDSLTLGGGYMGQVTFVKLDIEGAELAALKGAESTIREQKPKLAVCVYHKPEDIWEIPALVLEYNPGYRLWLRHYSLSRYDTVLYAVP